MKHMSPHSKLPDVAHQNQLDTGTQKLQFADLGPLSWVGMQGIEVPVKVLGLNIPALVDAEVSLDQPQRGIHMSRLYTLVQEYFSQHTLESKSLEDLLQKFLDSHERISINARLELRWKWPLLRQALKSENQSWRQYPVSVTWQKNLQGQLVCWLSFTILYSSTCPASAALARQLIQEKFAEQMMKLPLESSYQQEWLNWFGTTEAIVATPHAQRSTAHIQVQLQDADLDRWVYWLQAWIDTAEKALQTPVQGAVKRVDEQAFAHLNGQNLMFCEDAARRLKAAFLQQPAAVDFTIDVIHYESLHPHNARCRVSRNS